MSSIEQWNFNLLARLSIKLQPHAFDGWFKPLIYMKLARKLFKLFEKAVDKARNMEHSGTSRNIDKNNKKFQK